MKTSVRNEQLSVTVEPCPLSGYWVSVYDANGNPIFSDMGIDNDTHGEYSLWAEWNDRHQPPGFQRCVEGLVEAAMDGINN